MASMLNSREAFSAAEPCRAMPHLIDTEVLIVGGGPVGISLAIDLAQRAVGVTVAGMRRGAYR